ncbi:NfeD family protein [Phenylobacterium sp.]|uniref:NfeD family protein n=1 Tax=Phenylobacterium sp. TaxID=1871053 RepID=UPI00272732D8|nr:NfeD family protein [Phenylobacterium sp.]MDO8380845.1 NfeD family protein [Phenylobacterium sp.]
MEGLIQLAVVNPFWVWAAIGALVLAAEVATGSGWLLWPAASAAATAVAVALFGLPWVGAVGLYAGLTIVTTLLAQRFWPARQAGEADDINDNVARLVGHHGKAIANFHDRAGRVFIDGKEWAADLDDDTPLARGAAVEVTGVSGARLRVRPAR